MSYESMPMLTQAAKEPELPVGTQPTPTECGAACVLHWLALPTGQRGRAGALSCSALGPGIPHSSLGMAWNKVMAC